RRLHDLLHEAGPFGEVRSALGHRDLLDRVDVQLQRVGLQEVDGAAGVVPGAAGADVRHDEPVRVLLTDDGETGGGARVVEGDRGGAGGHRHAGLGGGGGQIPGDRGGHVGAAGRSEERRVG